MGNDSLLRRLTSTKFILTLAAMASIITIAIKSPAALTTELIVGILGAIATYSGSNAFLTGLGMKNQPKNAASEPMESEAPAKLVPAAVNTDLEARVQSLEERMYQNEQTTAQLIEIVKQLSTVKK